MVSHHPVFGTCCTQIPLRQSRQLTEAEFDPVRRPDMSMQTIAVGGHVFENCVEIGRVFKNAHILIFKKCTAPTDKYKNDQSILGFT